MATQSKACCTVPAVVSDGYQEKGKFIQIADMKTYATGSSSAKKGILLVYDIFGFFPQTLQGADILASGDQDSYQVFIPDFFDGAPADISWYPPDNKEKEKKLGEFFNTTAAPPKTLERIPKVLKQLEAEHGIQEWGIVGFCWGGKVVNLASQEGTSFKVAAAAHPAMIDGGDAEKITIPIAMLLSGDESKEDMEKWEKQIKTKNLVKWFPDQIHGFMAARSDLKDPKVKEQYEKGYEILLNWLHESL